MSERSQGSSYDIYLVGVGGQGVLTVGDLIAEAAMEAGLAVNVYPTKGMAQRGGSVTVQVRLGRDVVGPQMPERAANLVVAVERSEALRAVRYASPGADFLLYGHVWEPTKVMLGKAPYPTLEQVMQEVRRAQADLYYLDPEDLPRRDGAPLPANVYVLGAALGHTGLGRILNPETVAEIVRSRWRAYAAVNEAALRAGIEANVDEA
ncbi:MAG: 2-oxoacid:acceptor oxidoreductase family protein [Anaerolineae bacterium]|jgi:indolepyruvate ferredoxin oxidoreductase beta subunit